MGFGDETELWVSALAFGGTGEPCFLETEPGVGRRPGNFGI